MPTRILDSSLLQLTIDFSRKRDYPWGEIMGYSISSDFMTELLESKRNGPALCMALSRTSFCLSGDVLLFPYVRNFHWSLIGVYLRGRVVVRCDSMANRDGEEDKRYFPLYYNALKNFTHINV